MSRNIDLPNSGQSAFQVWPIGGPLLFKGSLPDDDVSRFRNASTAIMVYYPVDGEGLVYLYSGKDAKTADAEKVVAEGLVCVPGTYSPWGVIEGEYVALVGVGSTGELRVWSARESGV